MNRITFVTSLLLIGIFALPTSSALTTSSVKASSQTYTATELGTLSGPFSQARSINNAGNIVGEASVGDDDIHVHAFLYQDECMTDLGTFGGQFSYASAINNVGQITGHATFPGDLDAHAFIFVGGPMQDLGKLPGSGGSIGSAINDNGTVTGESREEVMIYRNGVMTGLHKKGALLAYGINNAEEIVGMLDNNHAFLFSRNHVKDIGTLYGHKGTSFAYAINNRGQVVGASTTPDGSTTHAFLYEDGRMTDLGTLHGGYSYAFSINNSGVIVGESDGAPFVYRDGVMTDLNSVTPKDADLFKLEVAWDINDSGHIVGRGFYLFKGSRAVLLTPAEPAP
jgi:probable HAF family extracellular repeat protein